MEFPDTSRGISVYADSAEFIMLYEPIEEKGRCLVKRVLYPLSEQNVVTAIEREAMLGYARLVSFNDNWKFYKVPLP